jgi:hypothetical protein
MFGIVSEVGDVIVLDSIRQDRFRGWTDNEVSAIPVIRLKVFVELNILMAEMTYRAAWDGELEVELWHNLVN